MSPNLTQRELAVLRLFVRGFSNAQIADELGISRFTVNAHLRNIYKRLGTSVRSEVIHFAHSYYKI